MEEPVTIVCPNCGFSKSVAHSAIPAGARNVSCPRCRTIFALSIFDRPEAALNDHAAGDRQAEVATPAHHEDESQKTATDPLPGPLNDGPAAQRERMLDFSFKGTGSEYFGIWIVNTLLKLITLGIYSAWAKVRKRRYFYGSTTLHNEPFDYLADPMALFKGWVIGAVAFLLYMLSSRVSQVMSMIVGLIIFIAVPWLIVRSRMFSTRNSSHRNIRFSFRPNYSEAYLVFLGLPLLASFTLGIMMPYATYRQKRFLVENSSYGMTQFSFHATAKDFYLFFIRITLVALAILTSMAVIFFLAYGGSAHILGAIAAKTPAAAQSLALFSMLGFFIFYFYVGTYVQTALTNLTWNATSVGDCRFTSMLRVRDMVWLYLSNAVAITCSLGLLIPWASVRMARYRFARLKVTTQKELDGFIAQARSDEISATGEEIGDIFGVNVDFGF